MKRLAAEVSRQAEDGERAPRGPEVRESLRHKHGFIKMQYVPLAQ